MDHEPNFVKYSEIPHLAEDLGILDNGSLQVFEKLDGGNSQVRIFNGKLFCGSRANFLRRERDFRFDWFRDFNKWAMSNHSFYNLPENLIVYGEFLAHHTLIYKPEFTNRFFMIDVYDLNTEKFLPYENARRNLESQLGVKGVLFLDTLSHGSLDINRAKELVIGESQYSEGGREGIVIKNYDKQRFAKFWRTSANPTNEGLLDEIKRVIRSIEAVKPEKDSSIKNQPLEDLSQKVFEELLRSGRISTSIAEIAESVKKVVNKI